MWLDIQGVHVSVADFLPFRILARLKAGLDYQSPRSRGAPNEGQHRLPGSEWHAGPVAADLAKKAMLDRIPLRASRGIVAYRHSYAETIADLYLQAFFPGADATPIAATRVSQHQEMIGAEREARSAFRLPPRGDGIGRERRRISRGANIDEAAVVRDVVYAVRHRASEGVVRIVMHVDGDRLE